MLEKPIDAFSQEEMKNFIEEKKIACPTCGKHNFTDIRQFNLMFKTFQGVTEDAKNTVYLRPETAQGIFVNFKTVQTCDASSSWPKDFREHRALALYGRATPSPGQTVRGHGYSLRRCRYRRDRR